MLDRLLNSGILQEAGDILKLQNRHNNSNIEKSNSFEELFAVKSRKKDNEENSNEVEIQLVFNGSPENTNRKTEPEKKIEDLEITDNKKTAESSKKEKENKNKSLNAGESNDVKNRNENEIKEKPAQKNNNDIKLLNLVSLKFKELNPAAKQNIEDIIEKYKAGRITENVANSMIMNVLKNSKLNNIENLKSVKIEVKNQKKPVESKNMKTDNAIKVDFGNIKSGSIEPEKNINESKSKDNKKELFSDIKKSLKNEVKENEKAEINQKNIKNDFVININELKTNDITGRNKSVEPQKFLDQNRENMFSQIAKNTKIVLSQGQTNFSSMIRPENFGRIDFKFTIKDGKVNGKMIFHNQETAEFFKANVQELKAVFQKANVELENIDLITAGSRFANNQDGSGRDRDYETENNQIKIKNTYHSAAGLNSFEDNLASSNAGYSNILMSKVNLVI